MLYRLLKYRQSQTQDEPGRGCLQNEATAAPDNRYANGSIYNIDLKNAFGKESHAVAAMVYNKRQQGYHSVGLDVGDNPGTRLGGSHVFIGIAKPRRKESKSGINSGTEGRIRTSAGLLGTDQVPDPSILALGGSFAVTTGISGHGGRPCSRPAPARLHHGIQ
jgi:hypothetical protein